MNLKRNIRDVGKQLLEKELAEVTFIAADQKAGVGCPIHRHDAFEMRFVFRDPSPSSGLARMDIVFPRVCHRALDRSENLRTQVLFLDPAMQYCQQPGSLPDFVQSLGISLSSKLSSRR